MTISHIYIIQILPNINYTLCFSNIILHYIVGGNKLIKGLLYTVGYGPIQHQWNVLSLGKGQGGMCNSSKRYKILNHVNTPAISRDIGQDTNGKGIEKIKSIHLSLI